MNATTFLFVAKSSRLSRRNEAMFCREVGRSLLSSSSTRKARSQVSAYPSGCASATTANRTGGATLDCELLSSVILTLSRENLTVLDEVETGMNTRPLAPVGVVAEVMAVVET